MAIGLLPNLSELSAGELYAVYVAVAEADHKWRLQAMYGTHEAPKGHSVFRKLPFAEFESRLIQAKSIAHGEQALRDRIARQAAAYKVDTVAVLKQRRAA